MRAFLLICCLVWPAVSLAQSNDPAPVAHLSPTQSTIRPLLWTLGTLHVISLVQTQYGLSHGFCEANPLLPSDRLPNVVVAGSVTTLQIILLAKLSQTQSFHDLARVLTWVSIGVQSFDVGHNAVVIGRVSF